MKGKILSVIIISFIAFINYSCNDTISPNAPFRERFILNGLMRGDTTYQVVTLTHSYRPDGLDPLSYKTDPALDDAEVNIYYKNQLYHMRDTTVARTDTSRYTDSLHYYYNAQLKPDANEDIEIEALLKAGYLLKAITKTPDTKYSFFDLGNSDRIIPPNPEATRVRLTWKNLGLVYEPRIFIQYSIKGDTTQYTKSVPLYYINGSPSYPVQSRINYVYLDLSTIKRVLDEIQPDLKSRANYSIVNMHIQLLVYDENLSNYYSSIKQGLDGFTIKLDTPDYTNIQGGYGIFASYSNVEYKFFFDQKYLQSFGYNLDSTGN